MRVMVVGARRSGKTKAMIDWFLVNPYGRCIITHDISEAARVLREIMLRAPYLDLEQIKSNIFSVSQVKDGHAFIPTNNLVAVDNADIILKSMLRVNIDMMTASSEEILDLDVTPIF